MSGTDDLLSPLPSADSPGSTGRAIFCYESLIQAICYAAPCALAPGLLLLASFAASGLAKTRTSSRRGALLSTEGKGYGSDLDVPTASLQSVEAGQRSVELLLLCSRPSDDGDGPRHPTRQPAQLSLVHRNLRYTDRLVSTRLVCGYGTSGGC